MNALTTTGTAVALPADPMQLMHLAERLAMARLIPPHFQKSPADCWLVMSFCRSRNLDFMMVVGECSVVQGRLFFSGKLTAALLNTSGMLAERLNYEYVVDDKGSKVAVVVSGRFASETTPRTVTVEPDQVKTNNRVWQTQPEQQLAYAGARIWGRRHAPEVLMGLLFEGETIDVTPNHSPVAVRLSDLGTGTMHKGVGPFTRKDLDRDPIEKPDAIVRIHDQKLAERMTDAERAAATPYAIELKGADLAHWTDWSQQLVAYIRAAPDVDTLNEWVNENAEGLVAFGQASPGNHERLLKVINDELAKRGEDAT